jgi:hypothetical protein
VRNSRKDGSSNPSSRSSRGPTIAKYSGMKKANEKVRIVSRAASAPVVPSADPTTMPATNAPNSIARSSLADSRMPSVSDPAAGSSRSAERAGRATLAGGSRRAGVVRLGRLPHAAHPGYGGTEPTTWREAP